MCPPQSYCGKVSYLLHLKKSMVEKGTLLQLKNVLNCSAIPAGLSVNKKSTDDFPELVLIVIVAREIIDW